MAVTWEPLVRLISNLEKAHPQVPSNISGKFQLDRTSGCRETAVADTHTDRQTDTHTEIAGIIDRWETHYYGFWVPTQKGDSVKNQSKYI